MCLVVLVYLLREIANDKVASLKGTKLIDIELII